MERVALRIVGTEHETRAWLAQRAVEALTAAFPRRQVVSFATIGIVCTLLYAALYHIARGWMSPLPANAIAIALTAMLNFLANRWHTFRIREGSMARQAAQYFALSVLAIGVTSLVLFAFGRAWARPPYAVEFAVAMLANALATVLRYVALTAWVFRRAGQAAVLSPLPFTAPPPAQAA